MLGLAFRARFEFYANALGIFKLLQMMIDIKYVHLWNTRTYGTLDLKSFGNVVMFEQMLHVQILLQLSFFSFLIMEG